MGEAATLRKLAALKLDPEQMAGVLSLIADLVEADENRRAKQRARKARSRDNGVTVTGQERDEDVTVTVTPSPKEKSPLHPSKEITPSTSLRSGKNDARVAVADLEREFAEVFYPAYPHKVQRSAALKAWPRARSKATLEQIIAGLQRYIRDKPPDQHWRNPATFLNGESWNDQPASPPRPNGKPTPHATILGAIARAVERRAGVGGGQAGADDGLPFGGDGSPEAGIVAGELAPPPPAERQ